VTHHLSHTGTFTTQTLQKNDAFQAEKGDGTTKAGAKGAAAALDFAGW
jgi:hypothetical protein